MRYKLSSLDVANVAFITDSIRKQVYIVTNLTQYKSSNN